MTDANETLIAAEKVHDAEAEHLAALQKKHATASEEIEKTHKRIHEFTEIPASKLCSNDLLNVEKSRRYGEAQVETRARLENEITAVRDRLRKAEIEVERAKLPLVAAEFAAQGKAISERLRTVVPDLAAEFVKLATLKSEADRLAASTRERIRLDEVGLALSTVRGDEGGTAMVRPGVLGDRFLLSLAEARFDARRIEEAARAAEARRAGEQGAAALSPEEREAAARKSWPGRGLRGPPRRDPLDTPRVLSRDDEDLVRRAHLAREAAEAGAVEGSDYDPFRK